MPAPCEVAVKSVIPAIRAYIAKELTQTYKMKQTDVAFLLGITQTAVSKYVSNVRGQAIQVDSFEDAQTMMNKIASKMALKRISGPELTQEFCEVCIIVRKNGMMCKLCRRSDPSLQNSSCSICME